MKDILQKQELLNLRVNPELIGLTSLQLQKDFASFSLEVFPNSEIPESWPLLFESVRPIIAELAKEDRHKLVQLFYRIDLSESLLAKSLSRNPLALAIDEITVMLIFREWKKVKFRVEHSLKNNDRIENDGSDGNQP